MEFIVLVFFKNLPRKFNFYYKFDKSNSVVSCVVSVGNVSWMLFQEAVAYPGMWGRGSKNSVEDRGQRESGSGGGSSLVRGSGGSCNLVQEISFHIVKFS